MLTPTVLGNGGENISLSLPLWLSLICAHPRPCTSITFRTCAFPPSLSLSRPFKLAGTLDALALSLPFKHTRACAHAHFPLTVLLCFVRINEKSSLALGVISVLGVK